jgi:FKBP-type peptidyl-prolyl cis-trans isomerase 2
MNAKFFAIALAVAMLAPAAGCLESVFNRIPIADFSATGYMESGSPITFDGTRSTDYDGNITTWMWAFGDGDASTVAKPVHIYSDVGTFNVTMTVVDNLGEFSTISKQIVISGKMLIRNGDYVEVDYIGRYASNGTIFDTSRETIASAAGIYNPLRTYEPLKAFIGTGTPTNNSYTSIIAGLREGLVGMAVGDRTNITIPPEKGYGNWTINEYSNMSRISDPSNITETYDSENQIYQYVKQNGTLGVGSTIDMIVVGNPPRTIMTATIIEFTNESITIRNNLESDVQFTDDFGFNRTIAIINGTQFRVETSATVGHLFVYQSYYGAIAYKVLAQNETTIVLGMSYSASAKNMIGETLVFDVEVVAINRN